MAVVTKIAKAVSKKIGKAATKNKAEASAAVRAVRDRARKLMDIDTENAKNIDGKPSSPNARMYDASGNQYTIMGIENVRKEKNLNQFKGAGKLAAGTAGAAAAVFGSQKAYEALSSKDKESFGNAFAKARRNKEETFTWRGGSYNTKLKRNSEEMLQKAESSMSKGKPKPPTNLNKGGMVMKSRTGNMDYRQGGLILSSVDNRKKKKRNKEIKNG